MIPHQIGWPRVERELNRTINIGISQILYILTLLDRTGPFPVEHEPVRPSPGKSRITTPERAAVNIQSDPV